MKILAIDDDPDMRFVLCEILPRLVSHSEVRSVADGSEAIVEGMRFVPDVVVLDARIGGDDPSEIAEALRDFHPSTHVVAFTGMADDQPAWADSLVRKGRDGIINLGHKLTEIGSRSRASPVS
jgi:two-component system response regulator YesN